MMMRTIVCLCVSLCLFCVAGYTDEALMRVGVLTDDISQFWTDMRDVMLAEAEGAGVVVDFRLPSPATTEQQAALARQLLDSGVQALAVAPVNPEKQTAWLNQLAQETNLVTVRTDAPEGGRQVFIGSDDRELGRLLAHLVLTTVPEGVKIMGFCDTPESDAVVAREAGMRDILADTMTVLEPLQSDRGDRMLAAANIADVLENRPEIATLIGLREYHGPLMVRAVMEAGRARWVRVVAIGDGTSMMNALEAGVVHGLVMDDSDGYGRTTLQVLRALAGAPDAMSIPDDGMVKGSLKAVKSDAVMSAEEMMDELSVQIPWISEDISNTP